MKELPDISIIGVGKTNREKVESLIAIEPILVMLGFISDERWNNIAVTEFIDEKLEAIGIHDNGYGFFSRVGSKDEIFSADKIEKLIEFMDKK